MKKISYFIIFMAVVGLGAISSWAYFKYMKSPAENFLVFPAVRGDIKESVKARGEVAALKNYSLGFSVSGAMEKIFIAKGANVKEGDRLASLNTREREFEVKRLEGALEGSSVNLAKLIAGFTKEDVEVVRTKVKNAENALLNAKRNLFDAIVDSYTVSDNAIRNSADAMIDNPRTASPSLSFAVSDTQVKAQAESERSLLEKVLGEWEESIDILDVSSDLASASDLASSNLDKVRKFLNLLSAVLGKSQTSSSVSATTLDGWKADVAGERVNINAEISVLSASLEKSQTALSALRLAKEELSVKLAGTRQEDIEEARAGVKEALNALEVAKDRLRQSSIFAPVAGKVANILKEEGETVSSGEAVISLSSSRSKIETDVSELDIPKVEAGKSVEISLDAFPGRKLAGKVASIDPEEIEKDGDKYYRVNISFSDDDLPVRAGMSADLWILGEERAGAILAPRFAVYKKGSLFYVKVRENGEIIEREIKTGISDGENMEIIEGVREGEEIIVSAD